MAKRTPTKPAPPPAPAKKPRPPAAPSSRPGSKQALAVEPAVAAELVALAESGAPDHLLGEAVGVKPQTFSTWRRMASDGHPELGVLFGAIERARARGALKLLAQMREAAAGGEWKAAATLLRYLHPRDFAERRQVDLTVTEGDAIAEALTQIASGNG
jgi:hypothetical protein